MKKLFETLLIILLGIVVVPLDMARRLELKIRG